MPSDVLMRITGVSPSWYVCEIRGAVFLSWVAERDRSHALRFPADTAWAWRETLEKMCGFNLTIESADLEPTTTKG